MEIISGNKDEIFSYLVQVKYFQTIESRKYVILNAGLDSEFVGYVNFDGSTNTFITNLIEAASRHGNLRNGENPIIVILNFLKQRLGIDEVGKINNLTENLSIVNRQLISDSMSLYLTYLFDKWKSIDSPLLPSGIYLHDIAVQISVSNIPSDISQNSDFYYKGLSRDKIHAGHRLSLNLFEMLKNNSTINNWILLGDPGSGKSTILLNTASKFANELKQGENTILPIFLALASFAKGIATNSNYSFSQFLMDSFKSLSINHLFNELESNNEKGKTIFFLDGLDEISYELKPIVIERLSTYFKRYPSDLRVVISSRKVGFKNIKGFELIEIEPLDINQQRQLMISICGTEKTKMLLKNIAGRPNLQDMAINPMALTVLSVVAKESSDNFTEYLHRHSDLFKLASEILLEGRHKGGKGVINSEKAEKILSEICYNLHIISQGKSRSEEFTISEFEEAFSTVPSEFLSSWDGPRHFIRDISSKSNIIYPIDSLSRYFKFIHRTFREYFTANKIAKLSSEERKKIVIKHLHDQHWSEVFVILGGLTNDAKEYVNLLLTGPDDIALRTLKEIKNLEPDVALKVLKLKPGKISDRAKIFNELLNKLKSPYQIIDLFEAYINSFKNMIPRIDLYFIYSIVSNLHKEISIDPLDFTFKYISKPSPNLFDAIQVNNTICSYWVVIPEGEFLFGADRNDSDRPSWVAESIVLNLSTYQIGVVPVTNRLFELFDPFHQNLREFTDIIPQNELNEHPVVNVSWYEAYIFTKWLNLTFKEVRLPSEFEWEKAASWDNLKKIKNKYPWGNNWEPNNLNSWEKGQNRTTAVGVYKNGISPNKVYDMAGNVWEWCLDTFEENFDKYLLFLKKTHKDPIYLHSGSRKVDRGGGWYHDVGRPTTFIRAADYPGDIFAHCGFRLVKSTIIPMND